MWAKSNSYRDLMRVPEGNKPLGRTRSKAEGNIKMDLREVGWDGTDWIDLV
jgi:hypothetical protein